jgi:hypothetical protein
MCKEHDASWICRETENALKAMGPYDQLDGLFLWPGSHDGSVANRINAKPGVGSLFSVFWLGEHISPPRNTPSK